MSGITLIALVITIIVLLVFAGIAISMIAGDNGILTRAVNAKKANEKGTEEDEISLAKMEALISAENTSATIYTEGDGEDQRTAAILPGLALMPSGENYTLKENTISTGLVAIDSNGNEYVWIEVPKNETIYQTAGMEVTDFSTTSGNLTKIETDLRKWSKDYNTQGTGSDGDEWYGWAEGAVTTTEKSNTVGCALTYDQYYMLKNKMLKSIYENGGFWIGRYEVGDKETTDKINKDINSEGRKTEKDDTNTPVVKINQIPYNRVTCGQAQTLASKMSPSTNTTSSLMFGVQWNLVCKFLEENSALTKQDINDDSTTWGNYCYSRYIMDRGLFSTSSYKEKWQKKKDKTSDGIRLYTTGASDKNRILNIYDFAGNLWEWTLEKVSSKWYPNARRGGDSGLYYNTDYPAAYRNGSNPALSGGSVNFGFRVTLY